MIHFGLDIGVLNVKFPAEHVLSEKRTRTLLPPTSQAVDIKLFYDGKPPLLKAVLPSVYYLFLT